MAANGGHDLVVHLRTELRLALNELIEPRLVDRVLALLQLRNAILVFCRRRGHPIQSQQSTRRIQGQRNQHLMQIFTGSLRLVPGGRSDRSSRYLQKARVPAFGFASPPNALWPKVSNNHIWRGGADSTHPPVDDKLAAFGFSTSHPPSRPQMKTDLAACGCRKAGADCREDRGLPATADGLAAAS